MVIFHSYVSLPEGTHDTFCFFDCGSLPQIVGRDGVACELVKNGTGNPICLR